jgi:hypothetical protein
MARFTIALLALVLAAPASAQQWQVAREQFAFAGRQLTIHVETHAHGSLQIIRGPAGYVRVSGRSEDGMTAAGLTADEHLTLTGTGSTGLSYVVSVPERVRISIRLPDRARHETLGSMHRSGTFDWGGVTAEPVEAVPDWIPAPLPDPTPTSAYTVYAGDLAPNTVALPDLRNVRSLTVRVEGDRFRIAASRPLTLAQGDPRHLEIRPGGPPLEVIVTVPAGTRSFELSADGASALTVRNGEVIIGCASSTRQWLSDGRRWVTFTPVAGVLECGQDTHWRRTIDGRPVGD